MLKINDIITCIETHFPPQLQEDYDNSGIQIADSTQTCSGIIIGLDCTEQLIDQAIEKNYNLVLTHHPLFFKGLKKIGNKTHSERIIRKAIKNDINILSFHTNVDNVLDIGVNSEIAKRLQLANCEPLSPKKNSWKKIVVFVPKSHADILKTALANAGAGHIGNYSHCSFEHTGTGQFKANKHAQPFIGTIDKTQQVEELKIEMLFPFWKKTAIIHALTKTHPYETPAYDIVPLETDISSSYGSGGIGTLPKPIHCEELFATLKTVFSLRVLKHNSTALNSQVEKIAFCGGAGISLLPFAQQKKADVFITADLKYHDYFCEQSKPIIIDIGHWESEQYTSLLFKNLLLKHFPTLQEKISIENTSLAKYYF